MPTLLERIHASAQQFKRETHALYFAARDPRTPWPAKLVIGMVVAYALSPIDLIPDFIPILGYLDDLVLLPLGIYLALRLIPAEVIGEARERAATAGQLPKSLTAAAIIVILWTAALVVVCGYLYAIFSGAEQSADKPR
jgi:uncharacterized membrane protein YkvA (DUF1232 family)